MSLSLRLRPFIRLSLLIQTCALLRHFLKRAIQDMCCGCKCGLFWQDLRMRGGGCIWGPAFQGLAVAFPEEKEAVRQKRDCYADRTDADQRNWHICLVDFSFYVTGMVWLTIQSMPCSFHGCLKLTEPPLSPYSLPTSSCPGTTGYFCRLITVARKPQLRLNTIITELC